MRCCSKCGESFVCNDSDEGCWCSSWPKEVVDIEKCSTCHNCRSSSFKSYFTENPERASSYRYSNQNLVTPRKTGELVMGTDYYINDDGLWVFTASYHLKKGYCCANGCVHCPYGLSPGR